jgi:nucleotide-binding universal stress UspA family protein
VATIGFTRGILTAEMYSIILMVAVVTSLMAPPILRWTLGHVQPSEEEQRRLEGEDRRKESFVGNLKRILVPVPSGDAQTTMAAKLVRLLVEEEDVEVTSLALQPSGDGGGKRPRTAVHDEVEDARSIVRDDQGDSSATIMAEAERGYDLLVLGATTRGTNGDGPLFEDFVDEVIQRSPCPLLVVSSRKDDDPAARLEELCRTRILVPTSGTDTDRYAAEVAFAMAAQGEAEVDLVHVVSRPQHELRVGTHEAIDQAVKIGEDILAKTGALGEAMGVTVKTDVVVATHLEEAIVERADQGAALVVMASGRKAATHRAFFGHRIDYVISHARCPVAVVASSSGNGPKK